MRVLIIGGTGLISTGIVKHLNARKADITMLNRGQRENRLDAQPKQIVVDRNDFDAFERAVSKEKFDVVIDMICFNAAQAESDVRAFKGRCGHFLFCSTVCTYGAKVPTHVLVDETFPQEPISDYGRNKVACEKVFLAAHAKGEMPVTIIRPSHTYGPGHPLIDNIEPDPVAWDRVERGLPILCTADGLGLWTSTHRDDCGKLFAYAAMNPKTFGQAYNATRDKVLTWRDYLSQVAAAIGKPAQVIYMPAGWIIAHDPKRFTLLREITQFHGAYNSAKAKHDVPEFRCEIELRDGAIGALADMRRRNKWKSNEGDTLYETMVEKALAANAKAITLS